MYVILQSLIKTENNMEIYEKDKAFANEFSNFVNGRMVSAEGVGAEMAKEHRYLQSEMFKVCIAYMKQLAINYHKGYFDGRNEWAVKTAATAYDHLIESGQVYDYDYKKIVNGEK